MHSECKDAPISFDICQISIDYKQEKVNQAGAVGFSRPVAYKEGWLGAGLRVSQCSDG